MLAVPDRIPIPPHLGGGFVDDPGPAPMDAQSKRWRRGVVAAWARTWFRSQGPDHDSRPLDWETWRPDEIEECARFARMKRDD